MTTHPSDHTSDNTMTGDTDAAGHDSAEGKRLLELALHLRMYGECAPGGHETWAQFDRDVEHYLRGLERPEPLPHVCRREQPATADDVVELAADALIRAGIWPNPAERVQEFAERAVSRVLGAVRPIIEREERERLAPRIEVVLDATEWDGWSTIAQGRLRERLVAATQTVPFA